MNRIASELKVAKSPVSVWVRDIPLTPDQIERLRQQNPAFNAQLRGQSRRREQAHEGSRRRNSVILTNSDPDMLAFFLRFLRRCYGVSGERVRLSCNCFLNNGLNQTQIEEYWLNYLGLSRESLCKTIVNRLSRASGGTKRTLPYGTARVAVHSTEISQSIYGAIQEYANFNRSEWLDRLR